ncbi:hypothetical protein M3Y96_01248600 [Aphelenchoides besseyi]|nr:hypothetical protein M3Y96_01248600 [Aphelenchoides besseyi]
MWIALLVVCLIRTVVAREDCDPKNLACESNVKRSTNETRSCSFGTCSQICKEVDKKPQCECAQGFELRKDGTSCQSTAREDPLLLFTNRYAIRLLRLRQHVDSNDKTSEIIDDEVESTSLLLISFLRNAVAMDYYYNRTDNSILVFWAETSVDYISRARVKYGIISDIQPIVKYGLWTAEGLAVDYLGHSIYWVDSLVQQISVTTFDGNKTTTVLSSGFNNLRAIVLDPREGYIFWSDWGQKPRIERANMDGSNRKMIVNLNEKSSLGGWPNGLTLDLYSKRVYWIDAKSKSIHAALYDGSDVKEVLNDKNFLSHPFAISLFEDRIYWTDWNTRNIYAANKFDGSNITTITKDTVNQPFDLKIVHSSRQPIASSNPCENNGGCSHLCLLNGKNKRCACPHLMTLEHHVEPKKCIPINQTLLLATKNTITAIDSDYPNRVVFPILSVVEANLTALGVNTIDQTIFWSDNILERLSAFSLKDGTRSEPKVLLKSGAKNCLGIAVDDFLDVVYYTGYDLVNQNSWIRVITSSGEFLRTLIDSRSFGQMKKPQGLVFHLGHLYWLDHGYRPAKLFTCAGNGGKASELKLVNSTVLSNAHSLSVYTKHVLIWSSNDVSYALNLTSMNLQTFHVDVKSNVTVDMLVADDRIKEFILYDKNKGNITGHILVNGQLSNMSRLLRGNLFDLTEMKLMLPDPSAHKLAAHFRTQCQRLGCSQLCLRSNHEQKCLCSDGYVDFGNGRCELPQERVLTLTSMGDLNWITNALPGQISSIPLNSYLNRQQQPRYFALGNDQIFYVPLRTNQLWSLNLKTRTNKMLFDGAELGIQSVAVNRRSGYVYVGTYRSMFSSSRGVLSVLDPQISDLRKTLLIVNETVESLQVDSTNGFVFWKTTFGIRRCRLDGSDFQRFRRTRRPLLSIAIDWRQRRLIGLPFGGTALFFDYNGNEIEYELKGMPNKTSNGLVSYDAIAVGPNANSTDPSLYFTTRQQLWRIPMNLLANATREPIARLTSAVIEIGILDDNLKSGSEVCQDANCEQFCFEVDGSARCDCVYSQISTDGRSCHRFASFIAYAHGSSIEFTSIVSESVQSFNLSTNAELNRREVEALQPIRNSSLFRAPTAVAVDLKRNLLFVSDTQTERIMAISINQTFSSVVVDGVKRIVSLAYDAKNEDLYFAAYRGVYVVSVRSLDKPQRPSIVFKLERNETIPGIAINPCTSTLIFTKQNSGPKQNQSTIESFELSGGNRTLLVNTNIESPNGLAVDISARKIYFANGRLDRIERMDEDGKNREIVLNNLFNDTLSNLFSLEVYLDRLYFTDLITNALYSVDKIAGEDMIAIRTDLHDQLRGFVVVAERTNECGIDECTQRKDELKCSNECRLNAAGSAYCVKKDVCDGQCLNGGRCHENRTTNTGFTCTCPQEYTGDRCETEKCSTFCKHGTCAVHPFTGIVMCNCDFGYTGIKCDQKVDVCADFCRNEGVCFTASNGVHCQCLPNFYGVQCQNCKSESGHVLVCKNGGYCNANRTACECPGTFSGIECEVDECSQLKCLNGGECGNSTDGPICLCSKGFTGKNCERSFCDDNPNYCQNEGICAQLDQETIDDSSANFHCLCGSRFAGDLCERSVDCRDYCENSEHCSIDSNQPSEWKCHCKEGFEGVRCERSSRCQKKCHLGQCVVTTNGTSECQCPHGVELVIDRNGEQSCTRYSAKNCDDLNCVYGACEVRTDSDKGPSATCLCFNGWQGLVCDQPACDHYCADGSNCSIVGGFAFCNCSNNQFGPRCDQTLPRITKKKKIDYSTRDIVLNCTPFALVILAIVVMSYLRVMKLSRNAHGNKQFQHERMYDDELPVDEIREFHNSAFLADDEGTLETRKLEDCNVYNETVLPVNALKGTAERFELLRSNTEFT